MIRLVILRMLESFFRHRWLYPLPIVILTAIGVVTASIAPPTYLAGASIFVEDQSLLASLTDADTGFSWTRTPAQTVVRDFGELLQTDAFVRSAVQRTPLESNMTQDRETVQQTLDFFRDSIDVSAVGNNLVRFRAEAEDPQLAQQMVVASIDAYVFWKVNAEYQESVAAQNFFANLIPPYEEELQRARDELIVFLASYPTPVRGERPLEEQVELARLQADVNEATLRLDDARAKEENARLVLSKAESIARQTYQVIDAPTVPTDPLTSLRQRMMDSLIYVAVGVLLSVMGILGGALIDRSFRFPIDVHHGLSLPVLASIGQDRSVGMPPSAAVSNLNTPVAEAMPQQLGPSLSSVKSSES
jgi:uncharacterized protein involved in exopolysaccharide biosynthesis